jgi:hypothetical protein
MISLALKGVQQLAPTYVVDLADVQMSQQLRNSQCNTQACKIATWQSGPGPCAALPVVASPDDITLWILTAKIYITLAPKLMTNLLFPDF